VTYIKKSTILFKKAPHSWPPGQEETSSSSHFNAVFNYLKKALQILECLTSFQCTSAVLHKLLCYDITHHTKETAAFIENDACFDRVVNNLLILCLQRLGMKPSAMQSLGLTWAQCIHYIRTQFGISSQSYRNTSNNPLLGPGQGSTIGPFLWIICYCLMVDSMRKDIPKFNAVSSVDRKRSLQLGLPL